MALHKSRRQEIEMRGCILIVLLAGMFWHLAEAQGQDACTRTDEPSLEKSLYHYRAVVTDVHDGDTVTVDVDLGFMFGYAVKKFG